MDNIPTEMNASKLLGESVENIHFSSPMAPAEAALHGVAGTAARRGRAERSTARAGGARGGVAGEWASG